MTDTAITPSYDRLDSKTEPQTKTATPAPPAAAPAPDEKVEFSPAQQAKVDQIIRESHSRIAREVRAENEKLRKSLDAALKAASPDASESDKLKAQLDAAQMRLTDLTQEYGRERLENAIAAAAHTARFIDPAQASLLIDKTELMDANGNVDVTKVTAAVQALATKSDHLIAGSTKSGSGSVPSEGKLPQLQYKIEQLFGRGSDAALANRLALSNPGAYKQARALAVRRGLI